MVTLLKLHLVCWLEGILQALYVFLVHNLKKFLEFHKLAKLIGTIGNKLFKNVKTYWIFMFSPTKHVFVKYRPLIFKMHAKSYRNDAILKNLDSLCDVEPIMRFPCILPMLGVCACIDQNYTKQGCMFVCDFVEFIKLVQQELY